jgi:hypothetical protein
MLDRQAIEQILAEVQYKDWAFHVRPLGESFYLQVGFVDFRCTRWTGRKWLISKHACKSEVVQTALKAVLTAEEHEARERFLYKGQPIFGPHKDVDALLAIADQVREEAVHV